MPFRVRFTDISILFPQFCSSARSNTERIREGVKKKKKKMVRSLLFLSVLIAASMMEKCGGVNVSYDGRSLVIDGQHKILFSGSIHYPRSTPQMWPSLIAKAREGGLDVIETLVFWNLHEPKPGQFDFSGRRDLVRFIKEIQAQGLYACVRIGPFIQGEWGYG